MEKKFVSGVVYLHNDEQYICRFLEKVVPAIQGNFSQYELIFVDDGCTDGTVDSVKEWIKTQNVTGVVSIVHMGVYQGLEASMNAGRDSSIGDFVFEFDRAIDDFDDALIMRIFTKSQEGFDVVSASSKGIGDGFSKLFYKLFNYNARVNISLKSEAFRIISRRAINRIKSMSTYIPYRKMLYSTCGLKHAVVEYASCMTVSEKRAYKKRRAGMWERSDLAFKTFAIYTNLMEKVSFLLALFFLIFSVGMIAYSIIDHFVSEGLADGWSSIVCIMSFGFFGVFALITIVLRYLSIIIDLNFVKQRMVIEDIEKIH